ncbi:MAG: toxin-antitoxin system HicB family antitoxin [Syntrophales bacterium]|nr:toxin-antitoxin system HicB family antitoxin [Syntrophales bacterium]MDD5640622.1 toxin-antitoxin system HicB family antitoxin [Syntrophales bacterium]
MATAIEYLRKPYSRNLIPVGDGTYFAEILEFPGCFAEGESPEEAYKNLEATAELWIEAARGQGQEIPEPFATRDFSGRIALRIPRSIHKQAARFAEMDDTSLNQFFLTSIAARVGAEEFYERLCNKLEAKCMTFAIATPSYTLTLNSPLWITGPVNMMVDTFPSNEGFTFPSLTGIQNSLLTSDEITWKELEGGGD